MYNTTGTTTAQPSTATTDTSATGWVLADFRPSIRSTSALPVAQINGTIVVVTDTVTDTGDIVVFGSSCDYAMPPSTPAEPVTDQTLAGGILAEAITNSVGLAQNLRRYLQSAENTIEGMRSYAIDAQKDGTICEDGLNTFLRKFGLKPYFPARRVDVTIRGSFAIAEGTDPDDIDTNYITVDIDGVTGADGYFREDDIDCDIVDDD